MISAKPTRKTTRHCLRSLNALNGEVRGAISFLELLGRTLSEQALDKSFINEEPRIIKISPNRPRRKLRKSNDHNLTNPSHAIILNLDPSIDYETVECLLEEIGVTEWDDLMLVNEARRSFAIVSFSDDSPVNKLLEFDNKLVYNNRTLIVGRYVDETGPQTPKLDTPSLIG